MPDSSREKDVPRAWKIAPGGHADNWEMCRDKGCIVIGWAALTDYSKYKSEGQVLRALQRAYGRGVKGASSGTARTIFQFTRVVKKHDIVVANRGYSEVAGIGIVRSDYLSPDSLRNPSENESLPHARRVEWVIKEPVTLDHDYFFMQPTVWLLTREQCEQIREAYLDTYPARRHPDLKGKLAQLFNGVTDEDSALAKDLREIAARPIKRTTKEALVNARVGQGKFRSDVLGMWGNRCAVTGCETLCAIRASHIKRWSESKDAERLDPYNGLPLLASLDALFEVGFISFEQSGKLLVSSQLARAERLVLGIGGASLAKIPPARTAKYLADHRDNRFQK